MSDLSIVILTYNSSLFILDCLESIVNLYKKEARSGQFKIIVADNASSDDTEKRVKEFIRKNNFQITFTQNGGNLGFGNGINRAMEKVKSRYALFLNPDAKIANRGLLKIIEYAKAHPKVKLLGGKMVDYDGKKELSAGKFLNAFRLFGWMVGLENFLGYRFAPQKAQKVNYVSGGAMMVDVEYFKKIGGFDKNFFMYVEDMELCYRVKKQGFETHYYPLFEVIHKGQGSSSSSFAYVNIFKGIFLFHKKHSSKAVLFLVQLILTFKCIVGIIVGFVFMKKDTMKTYKEALRFNK